MFRNKSILTAVFAAFTVIIMFFSNNLEAHGAGTAALHSAVVQGDQVVVSGTSSVSSEDGILHLYAQETYQSGAQGVEVAQIGRASCRERV